MKGPVAVINFTYRKLGWPLLVMLFEQQFTLREIMVTECELDDFSLTSVTRS